MNTSEFRTVFPRQLRYWTLHCTLNALPSFGIALFFLQLWTSPIAVAAMLGAIGSFILLYATITSWCAPLAAEHHVLSRAIKLGAKIRAWISGLSIIVLPLGGLMITPDFWCGYMAVGIVNEVVRSSGGGPDFLGIDRSEGAGFLPVYATTLLEGFILSFILLMISFFALIFLQARDRRNFFAGTRPNAPSVS